MKDNILSLLQIECPFPRVFEETESQEGCSFPMPRRKNGHIRADYDGCRWWNTVWPCHRDLATPEICREIDKIYNELTSKDTFRDLATLRRFCTAHMEACISKEYRDEFSFFLEGESCNFWVRLITRKGDYNLYLNAYAKGADNESIPNH